MRAYSGNLPIYDIEYVERHYPWTLVRLNPLGSCTKYVTSLLDCLRVIGLEYRTMRLNAPGSVNF